MFNAQQALAMCTATLAQRVQTKKNVYMLYATNESQEIKRTVRGATVKALIEEFRTNGTAYSHAYIVKESEPHKILRFYNRSLSKKFFSMTRKRTRK